MQKFVLDRAIRAFRGFRVFRVLFMVVAFGAGMIGVGAGVGCERAPEAGGAYGSASGEASRVGDSGSDAAQGAIVVEVTGMHCEGCSAFLTEKLAGAKGVENVRVSFKDSKAWFTLVEDGGVMTGQTVESGEPLDAGVVGTTDDPRVSGVIEIIEGQGYTASVVGEPSGAVEMVGEEAS